MSTSYDVVPTPVGPCSVVLRDGKVCEVRIGRRPGVPARRANLPEARRWTGAFFAGKGAGGVPLDLSSSTPFERRVYRVVRRIGPGRTRTYAEVARAAGRPGAARAVGNALARNPVCLFIP